MKTLWNVTFSDEILVLAETRDEASKVALRVLHDREVDPEIDQVSPMFHLPAGWNGTHCPFSDDDSEATVDELLAQGAAPGYTSLLERLKKAAAARRAGET